MATAALTERYRGVVEATRAAVLTGLANWWERVDDAEPQSFRELVPVGITLISAAQTRVAAASPLYLAAYLRDNGVKSTAPPIDPAAFAGQAIDGRPLGGLLFVGVLEAQRRAQLGESRELARARGFERIGRGVVTEISDAGREALAGAMVLDDAVTGFGREVRLPSCGRCVALAGERYELDGSFDRHPRCDCVPKPLGRRLKGSVSDPAALFAQMSPAEQSAAVGVDAARRVRDGEADFGDVVKSQLRHGGVSAPVPLPPERAGPKPSPLALRLEAAGDAEKYRRALAREGYLPRT